MFLLFNIVLCQYYYKILFEHNTNTAIIVRFSVLDTTQMIDVTKVLLNRFHLLRLYRCCYYYTILYTLKRTTFF